MIKAVKVLFSLFFIAVFVTILIVNFRLYNTAKKTVVGRDTINTELLKELRGLKHAVANKADEDM